MRCLAGILIFSQSQERGAETRCQFKGFHGQWASGSAQSLRRMALSLGGTLQHPGVPVERAWVERGSRASAVSANIGLSLFAFTDLSDG